jgi:5-oxoprolinase (ATP-hydrolysing)
MSGGRRTCRRVNTSIEIGWGTESAMRAAFVEAHQRLYGFVDATSRLVVSEVAAEAIARTAEYTSAASSSKAAHEACVDVPTAAVWMGGAWREVPLLAREALHEGQQFAGPAS